MSEPVRYTLSVTGLTPIMFNRFPTAEEEADKKSTRDKVQFEREHIKNRLYLTADGEPYVPASAVKKMLIRACAFVVEKPKGSFKSYGPLIDGALFVEDDLVLNVEMKNMIVDERPVSLNAGRGKGGGSGMRARPLFPVPWGGSTTCLVVDDGISKDMLALIAGRAGRLCGLMDGRKIDMGRCDIKVTNGRE
jgi:hypothetical protein